VNGNDLIDKKIKEECKKLEPELGYFRLSAASRKNA
jgi:hypothetical protein